MDIQEVFRFMDNERLGVLTTATRTGHPQAALMGFAVTPELEIIFDTVRSSRKYPNLKQNPRVAWVVGCTSEVTVQYEGEAEELEGTALAKYKPIYFQKFPDGPARENWAGMTYFVVRPKWVRYCDYNPSSRRIEEQRL
ncbi:MAG TPA: pyridoxamine 5'-phosphate oxidase family protein [Candidatus Limnocylindrales bacterium]|nr:pyridoxamine 5'-phosphate oxidase family protein [Candidatus Limnocylindrales bacterium]